MRTKVIFILFSLLLVSCFQSTYSPTIRFPYKWLDTPGFGGDIDQQKLLEPSGICFHPSRKTLFVVSDEGEIAEMNTDGSPVFRQKIPGDLEGVTVNPQSGFLYIISEGIDVILEYDPEKREVIREFTISREYQGNSNFLQRQDDNFDNGIESISFVPDDNHPEGGTFYIGNQWDPSCIFEAFVPLKSESSKISHARIMRVLPLKLDDPAAMYYDPEKGCLNVVSDADNILVEITLEGQIINEYAFLGDNQEGLTRDDEGYLYITQDSGGILKVKDLR